MHRLSFQCKYSSGPSLHFHYALEDLWVVVHSANVAMAITCGIAQNLKTGQPADNDQKSSNGEEHKRDDNERVPYHPSASLGILGNEALASKHP